MSKKVEMELGVWGLPANSSDSLKLNITQEEICAAIKAIPQEELDKMFPQHTGSECFANISRTYFWCCPPGCPACAKEKEDGK